MSLDQARDDASMVLGARSEALGFRVFMFGIGWEGKESALALAEARLSGGSSADLDQPGMATARRETGGRTSVFFITVREIEGV